MDPTPALSQEAGIFSGCPGKHGVGWGDDDDRQGHKPHYLQPPGDSWQRQPQSLPQDPRGLPSLTTGPLPYLQASANSFDFPQGLSKQKPMAAETVLERTQLLPHSSSQGREEGGATASTANPGKKGVGKGGISRHLRIILILGIEYSFSLQPRGNGVLPHLPSWKCHVAAAGSSLSHIPSVQVYSASTGLPSSTPAQSC